MQFKSIASLQKYCRDTYCCMVDPVHVKEYLTKVSGGGIRAYIWNDEWELPEFAKECDRRYSEAHAGEEE